MVTEKRDCVVGLVTGLVMLNRQVSLAVEREENVWQKLLVDVVQIATEV
jgi:hypothetical protein